jgi:MoxR-like ATPase
VSGENDREGVSGARQPTTRERLSEVERALTARFLGREEAARLLVVCVLAREHLLFVGPPGTAKSALIRTLAGLVDARYFEYLLTRFTEPNELFGPVDIAAFREGTYARRTEGMLPEAEIVFLDEIWKSGSAILNTLLTLLSDRRFTSGGRIVSCPLVSVFAASNEVPADDSLAALFDRFLVRVRADYLDAHRFGDLLAAGIALETASGAPVAPLVGSRELADAERDVLSNLRFSDDFLAEYRGLVFQIRAEGIALSDRRVVKLLKLFAANAYLDGRDAADPGDLFLLRHVWNAEDQRPVLDRLVTPVLDSFHDANPSRRRVGAKVVNVETLSAEVDRIREILLGNVRPSDLQLMTQLAALGELRAVLAGLDDPGARQIERRIAELLDATLRGGRFVDP